jgi:hypothetical protein
MIVEIHLDSAATEALDGWHFDFSARYALLQTFDGEKARQITPRGRHSVISISRRNDEIRAVIVEWRLRRTVRRPRLTDGAPRFDSSSRLCAGTSGDRPSGQCPNAAAS